MITNLRRCGVSKNYSCGKEGRFTHFFNTKNIFKKCQNEKSKIFLNLEFRQFRNGSRMWNHNTLSGKIGDNLISSISVLHRDYFRHKIFVDEALETGDIFAHHESFPDVVQNFLDERKWKQGLYI